MKNLGICREAPCHNEEALSVPEACQSVLGEIFVTLKARFIGIEDGQSFIRQHRHLVHLRDIGPLSRYQEMGKEKAEDGAGTYCIREVMFVL